MIGIHSRMSLDEIQLLLVLSTFWFFFLSGIVYQNLLQQQWRQPVSISSFFLLRIPQAANARDPLHTTKASLLHRQNSNARVTKAEEAPPAAEHREEEEASDKAIISCTYHSSRAHEVFHALGYPQALQVLRACVGGTGKPQQQRQVLIYLFIYF